MSLAERRLALLANQEKWKERHYTKTTPASDIEVAKTTSSLAARKNALLQSSGEWKNRVTPTTTTAGDDLSSLSASERYKKVKFQTATTAPSAPADSSTTAPGFPVVNKPDERSRQRQSLHPTPSADMGCISSKSAPSPKTSRASENADFNTPTARPSLLSRKAPLPKNRRPPTSPMLYIDTTTTTSSCSSSSSSTKQEHASPSPGSGRCSRTPSHSCKRSPAAVGKENIGSGGKFYDDDYDDLNQPPSKLASIDFSSSASSSTSTSSQDEMQGSKPPAGSMKGAGECVSSDRPENMNIPQLGVKNCGIALKTPNKKRHYPDVMLIRCKGTTHIDARLVAPDISSLHECASFVCITDSQVFVYEGEMSCVLEKNTARRLAYAITSSHDLCRVDTFAAVKEEPRARRPFFAALLRGQEGCQRLDNIENHSPVVVPSEMEPFLETDEESGSTGALAFESTIEKINRVYEIESSGERVILEGTTPGKSILDTNKLLVFDFGTEIYAWIGHKANRALISRAMDFAYTLKSQPLTTSIPSSLTSLSPNAPRPHWVAIRKLPEGLPDCLFRFKFSPPLEEVQSSSKKQYRFSTARFITVQRAAERRAHMAVLRDEEDVIEDMTSRMLAHSPTKHVFELEETELHPNDPCLITEGMEYFQLCDDQLVPVGPITEFFDSECYVIKWNYQMNNIGVRKLDGTPASTHNTGRQRTAYFTWYGTYLSKKNRGSCAFALRDFDVERQPHHIIEQGQELPIFLHLFSGLYTVSSSATTTESLRVYVVHGPGDGYVFAEEIAPGPNVVARPQASYLLVDSSAGTVTIAAGGLVPKKLIVATKALGHHVAGLRGFKMVESNQELLTSGRFRFSVEEPADWVQPPVAYRLFESSAALVSCPQYSPDVNFTLRQSDLRDTLIIDQGTRLWVWTDVLVTTMHIKVADRFWSGRDLPAYVVCKSQEPPEFRALFPSWTAFPDPSTDSETPGFPAPVQALDALLDERTRYRSLDDVRQRRLPPGCDLKALEKFLNDEDFTLMFKMSKDEFYTLPKWKQTELRKAADLF